MPGGSMKEEWIVYLIETENGKIYTGITKNLQQRLAQHQNKKGARFFRFSNVKKVLYTESCSSRSEATKREIAIKKLSRSEKLALVNNKKSK